MHFIFEELIDLEMVQGLLESFGDLFKCPLALIDPDGNIVLATEWQKICSCYHSPHETAGKVCQDHVLEIARQCETTGHARIYQCPMGLVDSTTPIYAGGQYLGSLSIGQVFMEEPDLEFFRQQARHYGFEEAAYLQAVHEVPVIEETQLKKILNLVGQMASWLSEAGLKRFHELQAVQAERDLAGIISSIQTGVFVIDPESHIILEANPFALQLIGRQREEVVGSRCQSFICPAEPGQCPVTELGQSIENAERKLLTVDSGELTILKTITPVQYRGKMALLESFVDISGLKQAEKALKENQQAFGLMAASAQDAIILINDEGVITFWNQAATRIFQYTAAEAVGQSTHLLLAPLRYHEQIRQAFSHWKSTGQGLAIGKIVELSGLNKAGQEIPVELSLASVKISGRWVGLSIIRDISERKQAEEELKKSSESLAEWVIELEQTNMEINLLREIGDLLQGSQSVEEAFTVVKCFAPRLFAGSTGALYMLNRSHKAMEMAASWGSVVHSEYFFAADSCRSVSAIQSEPMEGGQGRCQHLESDFAGDYLDVPMMVASEVIGLLYIEPSGDAAASSRTVKLAPVVAEQFALSLSNIKLREELKEQSIKDPLTQLFNRRYCLETLQREINRACRGDHSIGIIILDVDNFKRFNDNYGHDVGDAVLVEFSKTVRSMIRGSDFACRWGGEEFVVVLPEASLEHTAIRAEQLRKAVEELPLVYENCILGNITISAGVAAYPQHGANTDTLFKLADMALYNAKNSGRNRVALA